MDFYSHVAGVFIRREDTQERRPCENRGRNGNDASISQATLKTAESRKETPRRFSLRAYRKNQLYQHLDFEFLASKN